MDNVCIRCLEKTTMKTVAIVINTAWNIYNFRLNLARKLKDEGYEVICIAPYDAHYTTKITDEFLFYSIPFDSKGINPFKDLQSMKALWKLYRLVKPDIVLNFTIKPNIYSTYIAKLFGIQVINTVTGLGTLFIKPSLITSFAQVLYKIAFCFTYKIFFQNKDDYNLFVEKKLVSSKKCLVIPGSGVDLQRFYSGIKKKEDGVIRFILVARMLKDKGVFEFIEASRRLKECYPRIKFFLLGPLGIDNRTAITDTEMMHFVKEGYIEYLGNSDDVSSILREMDCVVLPSYREGIPRSLLEAAAMSKPIITTNVVGCKEVVDHGINGFLCEPKNVDSLYNAIEKMLLLSPEERFQMGKKGREKMEIFFDESIVIKVYLDAIQEALNSL